jgi:glutamine amidotransferase
MKSIAIIDYSLGNLFSVEQALIQCGAKCLISSDASEIANADAIVLPGVGAFSEAMGFLRQNKLDLAIQESIANGKQFLGICLGMQLLFDRSEEFGATEGLGIISGEIKKFRSLKAGEKLHVPQVGWNTINEPSPSRWSNTPLKDLKPGAYMYFVHSFYVTASQKEDVLSTTVYGGQDYCSSISKKNVTATQFHPEKSGEAGLSIYKNWLSKI